MENKYTRKQITESICYWTKHLLENGLATEEECRDLLGEGLFKRAKAAVKRGWKKTKEIAHAINWAPQKIYDKVFKPNEGVKKLVEAMATAVKQKIDLSKMRMYVNFGGVREQTYPIIGFTLLKKKSVLMMLVNRRSKSAKPQTLGDLRKFVLAHDISNIAATIESIQSGEVPQSLAESILLESKLSDFIEKNKLTKKQALRSDNFKQLKRLIKQGDEKTKTAIEKYFQTHTSKKSLSSKSTSKSSGGSTSKKPSKQTQSPSFKQKDKELDAETRSREDSGEPMKNGKPIEKDIYAVPDSGSGQFGDNLTEDDIVVFDNELINVKNVKNDIGFMFGKTKAEIALDKKFADALSL